MRLRFHDAAPTPGESTDPLSQILQRLTALEQAVALLVQGDDDTDGNDAQALPDQIAQQDINASKKTRDRRLARDRQTSTSIASINDQNRKRFGIAPMPRWGN